MRVAMNARSLLGITLFAAAWSHARSPSPRDVAALPPGVAQVCMVRPEAESASVTMTVRDNGRLVGATRGKTYVCWLAAPGAHQIGSDDDDTGPILLRAESGARYWLHQEVLELGGVAHAHLDFVDAARAEELLEECDERVMVNVPGHDDHPAAQPVVPATRM